MTVPGHGDNQSMLVINAGHRERQALLHWWSCLNDDAENRSERGKQPMGIGEQPIGPFWRALDLASNDARLDAISWRGETKTVQEINAMQRRPEPCP